MSKNDFKVGIVYVLLGSLLAVYALMAEPESKLNPLLFGFGFSLITPGLMLIGKFIYFTLN